MRHLFRSVVHAMPMACLVIIMALSWSAQAAPAVGRVKVSKGSVHIERDGKRLGAGVGMGIEARDTVVTGADGTIGITFQDDSMLSAGPHTVLTIEKYVFDRSTNQGEFETAIKTGTLAAVSGKIVKQAPGAMKIRTPTAIMGVRGTHFAVRVNGTVN